MQRTGSTASDNEVLREHARAMIHGTRRTYRLGCHCCPCRAANAAYEAQRVRDRLHGRQTLGQRVSPVLARKRVKQLQVEQVSAREIARRLGLKNDAIRVHPDGITVRKLGRILRLYNQLMAEDPDLPMDASA